MCSSSETTVAVVLAGGTGTRLYPASRAARPKQFLAFGGERSLLVRTVERVGFADATVVLTGPAHADRTREHLADAGHGGVPVLVEPEPKDTGPAMAYAAAECRDRFDDPVLLVTPSDHHVDGDFAAVGRRALRVAVETRGLVTIGIEPTRPAGGYGYLSPGRRQDGYAPVERFHEKPDRETARRLVDEGWLWNAGIFAWTPAALFEAARGTPLADLVAAVEDGDPDRGFDSVDPVSVDHAVMERTDDAFVVPADLAWDDLGSWDALARVLDADADGNVSLGESLTVDASDNVIASDDKHVSVVGVEDLVVAAFDDRVLVVPGDEAQRVREVVSRLRDGDRF